MSQDDGKVRTLALKPSRSEASKPAELIQINGHSELTLNARRAITILWHNAHLQGIREGRDYTIEIDDLKPDKHKGYERVEEAVEALMRTILIVKMRDGATRRVQFLGGNDMDDPNRPSGVLTYSFDNRLIAFLKDSTIWGKIAIPVLMAFTSKYAISLYENIAQMANLDKKTGHDYSLDELRDMLGVMPGKYKTFGELNKHVIKPAVDEINAMAGFNISLIPVKQGKRVTSVRVGWWTKDASALRDAFREVHSTKLGRRARINGTVETVSPMPSLNRMVRQARLDAPKTS